MLSIHAINKVSPFYSEDPNFITPALMFIVAKHQTFDWQFSGGRLMLVDSLFLLILILKVQNISHG